MVNNYITNSIIDAKLVPMSESMERSARAQEQGAQGVVFLFLLVKKTRIEQPMNEFC
jgi:hypothetical protein